MSGFSAQARSTATRPFARLADHFDVGPVGEQRAQALAHCFVILGDEHADLLHDPAAGPSAWLATGASR